MNTCVENLKVTTWTVDLTHFFSFYKKFQGCISKTELAVSCMGLQFAGRDWTKFQTDAFWVCQKILKLDSSSNTGQMASQNISKNLVMG